MIILNLPQALKKVWRFLIPSFRMMPGKTGQKSRGSTVRNHQAGDSLGADLRILIILSAAGMVTKKMHIQEVLLGLTPCMFTHLQM